MNTPTLPVLESGYNECNYAPNRWRQSVVQFNAAVGAQHNYAGRFVVATTQSIQVAFMTLAPGESTGAEVHSMREQTFLAMPGSGPWHATIDGEMRVLGEGDFLLVTRHTRHVIECPGAPNTRPALLFTQYSLPTHGAHVVQQRLSEREMPQTRAERPRLCPTLLQTLDDTLWIEFDAIAENAPAEAVDAVTRIARKARRTGGVTSIVLRQCLVSCAPFASNTGQRQFNKAHQTLGEIAHAITVIVAPYRSQQFVSWNDAAAITSAVADAVAKNAPLQGVAETRNMLQLAISNRLNSFQGAAAPAPAPARQ